MHCNCGSPAKFKNTILANLRFSLIFGKIPNSKKNYMPHMLGSSHLYTNHIPEFAEPIKHSISWGVTIVLRKKNIRQTRVKTTPKIK